MKNSTLFSTETINENSFSCCFKNVKRNSNIFLIMILFMGSFIQSVSAQGTLVPACNLTGPLVACSVPDSTNISEDITIIATVARSGAAATLSYSFVTNSCGAIIRMPFTAQVYNAVTNVTTQSIQVFPGTGVPEFNLLLSVTNHESNPDTFSTCSKSVSISKVAATSSFTPILCFGGVSTLTVVGSFSDAGTYTYTLPGFPPNSTGVFPGLPGSVGGITYTVTVESAEDCLTSTSQTITQPAVVPIVFTCPVNTTSLACPSQTDLNTAFNAWLATFSSSGGTSPVTVTRTPSNPTAPSICGGVTEVTWSAIDACLQVQSCTRTFTVTAPPTVVLTCPTNTTTTACQTQAAVDAAYAAWLATAIASGGCNGDLDNDSTGAPLACGGSKTVIFTYTSSCAPLTTTCSATFTVTAPPAVMLTCPANLTIAANQTPEQISAAFATWLETATASGGCNGDLTNNSAGAPACGATATVIFTYTSSCEPFTSTCTATFTVPPCVSLEGCTLGYWKNHTNRWCGTYRTCDRFGDVFTSAPSRVANLTLLQALNTGGGGIFNLARQAVAALLNTCSGEVAYAGYGDNPALVIAAVNLAFTTGGTAPGILGSQLDVLNNSGCPLGGTSATTASNCILNRTTDNGLNGVTIKATVYPNPFADNFKLDVKTISNEVIEVKVFDMLGKLIETNFVKTSDIDTFEIGNSYKAGIYNVVVTQGTEVITQKVIKK